MARRGRRWTWAIGDIQGCAASFSLLRDAIAFDPAQDVLWLAGDLINRGPGSLEVLRWVVAHEGCVQVVLGNHDLHLLACDRGFRKVKARDTLTPILEARDREALVGWLRRQPLMVRDGPFTMLHAGLAPQWSLDEAQAHADRLSAWLAGPDADALLSRLKGRAPALCDAADPETEALAALAVLTRMRSCTTEGRMSKYVGPPESCPPGERPWYAWRRRPGTVLFGHWAAHDHTVGTGWVALDSGAVWGGRLTAWRLEDGHAVSVPGLWPGLGGT